jgi:gliding motility-associated-like protein
MCLSWSINQILRFSMKKRLFFLFLLTVSLTPILQLTAQNPTLFCAGDQVMQQYLTNPTHKNHQNGIEEQIHRYLTNPAVAQSRSPNAVVILPVVVHIVHNGGTENVSNAQVLKGIQDLNDAFGNRGYYDPTTGVNTDIQFCLAQRDPNNQTSNGITRDVSPLTNMTWETDDISLKNINRWRPTCYINIWLVKEVNSSSWGSDLVGYAYYPSAHGTDVDGIVMEARWFGTSPANSSVVVHEMGHYLGLYHTFNGDCGNRDCLTDGDRVCDTPPDQSQGVGCSPNVNSCTTDADDPSVNNPFRAVGLGGRGDVADMGENYMDYSPLQCYSIFTAGQKERMNWHIQNVRQSLLACKSCELPCSSLVSASFSPRGQTIDLGTSLTFTSTSTNATTYKWRVGATNYSTQNITHPFNAVGSFNVVFEASNADARCASTLDSVTINVLCPVKARIVPPLSNLINLNTPVTFKATAQNATTTKWTINNATIGTDTVLTYTFNTVGSYNLFFIASNGTCADTQRTTVVVSKDTPTLCNNRLFSKVYLVDSRNVDMSAGELDKNNSYIMTGFYGNSLSNNSTFIARIDSLGKIIFGKKITGAGDPSTYYASNFRDIKPTRDGGYIGVGVFGTTLGITKFSNQGDIEWSKIVADSSLGYFKSVIQTQDGGFAAIGRIARTGILLSSEIIAKFRSDGTLIWSNYLSFPSAGTFGEASLTEMTDGNLVIATGLGSSSQSYLIKLNTNTGGIIWQKQFSNGLANVRADFRNVLKTADAGLLVTGSINDGFFMKLDNNGDVVFAKRIIQSSTSFLVNQILQAPNKGYFLSCYNTSALVKNTVIFSLDSNATILWQKFVGLSSYGSPPFLIFNNGDLLIGFNQAQNGGFTLSRFNNSVTSCENLTDSYAAIQDITIRASSSNVISTMGAGFRSVNPLSTPIIITQTSRCPECKEICNNGIDDDGDSLIDEDDVVDCPCRVCFNKDSLKIVGLDTLCIGAKLDYRLQGFKCAQLNPLWFLFKSGEPFPLWANITGDSTAGDTFRFRKSGYYLLSLNNLDSCPDVKFNRNKAIYVLPEPPVLKLGADKSVCKTGVFTFNAKRGFKSYLWQDGSTDSTFTAFNIGKYWVRVQDSCGGVQSDTIRVNLAASPPLNISPDTFRICEGDSIVVNAPTGFTSYRWSPSAGVNDTFRRQITLTPSVSGTYYCAASTAQGCVNQDSIFVDVTPLTRLTNSETICGGTYKIGDSTFTKSGNYRIILRGRAAACDTVVLLNLKINDVKIETQVFNACPNQRNGRIVATAKNGSLPYIFAWNTGGTSADLRNLATGTYRLTVTDANNCTDTTSVTVKATPQYAYSFLVKNPKCFGDATGEIRLNSTEKLTFGFDSTASNKTGFVANLRANSYTVFVKDSNNCVFSQTIAITQPPPLTLVLQADTIIRLGDSLSIKPTVSGGTGRLKYRWQPSQGLNCDTCKTVISKPTTGILYTLVVTDSAGCTTNEKLRIEVNKACKIFIPNVFSPFGSIGANDVFYPFGDICADRVVVMQIFDRWGEQVFQKTNFPLNDATSGWDGTFRGKELNPNVFTYRIDIQLIDGRVERFAGDVTLLR